MKLKLTTPNGITTLALGQSPPSAGGAKPTGVPGVAALQVLSGMGHGATSGLGGADWVVGCGVYRGENYIPGPSFNQESDDANACSAAGIGRLCSPSAPRGVWQFPWRIALAASEEATVSLTLPIGGRLFAYEVCVVRVPLEVADPCPCEGTGCSDCGGTNCGLATVGGWASRQITSTYPGLGRETGIEITAPAPVAFAAYNPNTQLVPACLYSAKRLLNGQNFLPPWVPNVDLKNGNDELSWQVTNQSSIYDIVLETVLHIRYGDFNLERAIEEFCEQQACAC